MTLALRFLGVGNAMATTLGSACAVLLDAGSPRLLIDLGPDALRRYRQQFGGSPSAVFVTHAHTDHIGDFEAWFYALAFADAPLPRLYVPAPLVPILQRRIADFPNWVAEGGRNFWDVFQLIPVSDSFWHAGMRFDVFAVRHHAPNAAFGIALPGSFVYSGDTRPIPDQLAAYHTETIFHDVSARANPSHTGFEELALYPPELRARLWLYHYGDADDLSTWRARYRIAAAGVDYPLPPAATQATIEGAAAWSR
jgi:ribonuclease BN (tRNA processing enzyme)